MDDLRSQLLKAGLVSEEQVRKAEKHKVKTRRSERSTKGKSKEELEAERRRQELEDLRQKDRERQIRKHEQQERKKQEKAERERQLEASAERARKIVQSAGIALDPEAAVKYSFVAYGRTVKHIQVTADQQRRLGLGELGIARPHANLEQYVLLPREAAIKLRECAPEKLMLLHDPDDEPDEFEGLMW